MNEKVLAFSVGMSHSRAATVFADGKVASAPCAKTRGPLWFSQDLILKSGAEEHKVGRKLKSKLFLNKSRETVTRAFISFCRGTNRKSPPNIIKKVKKVPTRPTCTKNLNLKLRSNSIESKIITKGEHWRGQLCSRTHIHTQADVQGVSIIGGDKVCSSLTAVIQHKVILGVTVLLRAACNEDIIVAKEVLQAGDLKDRGHIHTG